MPEILKPLGYATGHFGKWHLGTFTQTFKDANRGGRPDQNVHFTNPKEHGYDSYFCTESKVPTFDPMIKPLTFDEGESLRFGWRASEGKRKMTAYGTYYFSEPEIKEVNNLSGSNSKIIMDRVIPFINQSAEHEYPFFSTIWFHTPHLPVVADSTSRAMYNGLSLAKQIYYSSITAMDEQVGRLWHHLEELGIADNTILWFCSDNGPEDGTPGSAAKFRERKRSLYEGGVRVPAFVIWPEKIEGGQRSTLPMVTSDYLPTIAKVLQIDLDTSRVLDGESVWQKLIDRKSERDRPIGFIFPKTQKTSWVNNQYKLISTDNRETYQLYDLITDPTESKDLISLRGDLAADMKVELENWLNSVSSSANGQDYSLH